MKNVIVTNGTETTLTSVNDGANSLIIDDVEIPSSTWVGSGTFTYGNLTIGKADSSTGNWMLVKESTNNYYFDRIFPALDTNNLCYKPGDTVSGAINAGAILTNSKQSVRFQIPLIKPVLNSELVGQGSISMTKCDVIIRSNGVYMWGSASGATDALTYLTASLNASGVYCVLDNSAWNNTGSVTNNNVVGVYCSYTFNVLDS